jgi:Domain of unknown function (DUF4190)
MTSVPPAPPGPAQQWGPPPAPGGGYGAPRTEGMAVAALVCAIASWVACPVILGVVALALAHAAGNKIDASAGRLTGEGIVRAAQIVAWINIALWTLATVAAAIVLVAVDVS